MIPRQCLNKIFTPKRLASKHQTKDGDSQVFDLADITTLAKLVEADCINKLLEELNSGLSKGMFKHDGNNTLFLGIQESPRSLESKRERTEILLTERVSTPSGTPQPSQRQSLIGAINSMQKSINNLHRSKNAQCKHSTNQFPYPSRGEFFV